MCICQALSTSPVVILAVLKKEGFVCGCHLLPLRQIRVTAGLKPSILVRIIINRAWAQVSSCHAILSGHEFRDLFPPARRNPAIIGYDSRGAVRKVWMCHCLFFFLVLSVPRLGSPKMARGADSGKEKQHETQNRKVKRSKGNKRRPKCERLFSPKGKWEKTCGRDFLGWRTPKILTKSGIHDGAARTSLGCVFELMAVGCGPADWLARLAAESRELNGTLIACLLLDSSTSPTGCCNNNLSSQDRGT